MTGSDGGDVCVFLNARGYGCLPSGRRASVEDGVLQDVTCVRRGTCLLVSKSPGELPSA